MVTRAPSHDSRTKSSDQFLHIGARPSQASVHRRRRVGAETLEHSEISLNVSSRRPQIYYRFMGGAGLEVDAI